MVELDVQDVNVGYLCVFPQVNEETVERLVVQYPHIVFSTVMQDCKRTLERAYQMGWSPNTSNTS